MICQVNQLLLRFSISGRISCQLNGNNMSRKEQTLSTAMIIPWTPLIKKKHTHKRACNAKKERKKKERKKKRKTKLGHGIQTQ